MTIISRAEIPHFLRDFLSLWEADTDGVTAKTRKENTKYRNHWANYASDVKMIPFLDGSIPPLERDIVADVFTARVRTGECRRVNLIKISGVTDILVDISNTTNLARQPSKLYLAGEFTSSS